MMVKTMAERRGPRAGLFRRTVATETQPSIKGALQERCPSAPQRSWTCGLAVFKAQVMPADCRRSPASHKRGTMTPFVDYFSEPHTVRQCDCEKPGLRKKSRR